MKVVPLFSSPNRAQRRLNQSENCARTSAILKDRKRATAEIAPKKRAADLGLYPSAAAFWDFLGLVAFSDSTAWSGCAGVGAFPSVRKKPLVTFSAMSFSANAFARVSVNANAELTLSGSFRLAEKSVQ